MGRRDVPTLSSRGKGLRAPAVPTAPGRRGGGRPLPGTASEGGCHRMGSRNPEVTTVTTARRRACRTGPRRLPARRSYASAWRPGALPGSLHRSPPSCSEPPRRLGVQPPTPARFASALCARHHGPGARRGCALCRECGPQVTSPEAPSLSIRGRHLLSSPYPQIRRGCARVCTHTCLLAAHLPRDARPARAGFSVSFVTALPWGPRQWLAHGTLNTRGAWKQPEAGL